MPRLRSVARRSSPGRARRGRPARGVRPFRSRFPTLPGQFILGVYRRTGRRTSRGQTRQRGVARSHPTIAVILFSRVDALSRSQTCQSRNSPSDARSPVDGRSGSVFSYCSDRFIICQRLGRFQLSRRLPASCSHGRLRLADAASQGPVSCRFRERVSGSLFNFEEGRSTVHRLMVGL